MRVQVLLLAKSEVDFDKLGHDDQDVPGTYQVTLKESIREDEIASAALDGFHGSVAVDALDDFTFTVHNIETGSVIEEVGDHEGYALEHLCYDVTKISNDLDEKCVQARVLSSGGSGPSL